MYLFYSTYRPVCQTHTSSTTGKPTVCITGKSRFGRERPRVQKAVGVDSQKAGRILTFVRTPKLAVQRLTLFCVRVEPELESLIDDHRSYYSTSVLVFKGFSLSAGRLTPAPTAGLMYPHASRQWFYVASDNPQYLIRYRLRPSRGAQLSFGGTL